MPEALTANDVEPFVSVLICTRNRKDSPALTVRSVLACDYPNFEVLILDQSEDTTTQDAMAFCAGDSRARYIRLSSTPGKPRALNKGWQLARGKYLLLTDDDCEVAADWIRQMVAVFENDPRVGCIFGDLTAAPHDTARGFIPDHRIETDQTLHTADDFRKLPPWANTGVGANMALRADIVASLQGWDTCIGPGTKFRSGDDVDMATRVLRTGHALRLFPPAQVVHHGYRFNTSARQDAARAAFGMGAMFAKHLRGGFVQVEALRRLSARGMAVFQRLVRLQIPLGLTYPTSFVRGVAAGLRHPVDQTTWVFQPVDDAESSAWASQVASVVPPSRRPMGDGNGFNQPKSDSGA